MALLGVGAASSAAAPRSLLGEPPDLAVEVVVDQSWSMVGEPLRAVVEALPAARRAAGANNLFGVVAFGDRLREVAPLGASTDARIREAVRRLGALQGGSDVVGALRLAALRFHRFRARRKLIVVITDGQLTDLSSKEAAAIGERLRWNEVRVALILLPPPEPLPDTALDDLVEKSGGRLIVLDVAQDLPDRLRSIIRAARR